MDSAVICPVCTLYLRSGISLEDHLQTHPKDRVINALIAVSSKKIENPVPIQQNVFSQPPPWQQQRQLPMNQSVLVPVHANNSSIIYQQFVSTNSTYPSCVQNSMMPQYIAIPANVFNNSTSTPVFNQSLMVNQPQSCNQQQFQLQASSLPVVSLGYPNFANSSNLIQDLNKISQIDFANVKTTVSNLVASPLLESEKKSEEEICQSPARTSRTPSVIQLADASASKVRSTPSPKADSVVEDNQVESVPIYTAKEADNDDDKSNADLEFCDVDKQPNVEDNDCQETDQLNVTTERFEDKNLDIEIYSSDNNTDRSLEILSDDSPIKSSSESDQNVSFETETSAQNKNEIQFCESNFNNSEEKSFEETIIPDISVYEVPKIEEKSVDCTTEQNSKCPAENSNIVIIQNEVVCLPNNSEKEENIQNNFKMEQLQPDDFSDGNHLNVVEFDGIKLMLNTDLINVSVTEQNLECIESMRSKSPPVLLNIGEMIDTKNSCESEEQFSRDGSLNMRADERMPPKGELSEQESNGANDEEWGKMFQEGSSGISTSYDLLARESWELASDSSDSELVSPLQSRIPLKVKYNRKATNAYKSSTKSFKCSICKESFDCPKERRVHQTKVHSTYIPAKTEPDANGQQMDSSLEDAELKLPTKSEVKLEESELCDNFARAFETGLQTVGGTMPPPPSSALIDNQLLADGTGPLDDEDDDAGEDEESKMNILPPNIRQSYCELCKLDLKTNKTFLKHYRCKHKGIPVPRYRCHVCNTTFSVEYKFTEHLKAHPLQCSICYKNFYRRQNFKLHFKRHLGVKPYKCDQCPKTFITQQKRKDHSNIHSGLAPYKCKQCDERFRRYSNLIQHRDTHHNAAKRKPRDFVCHCGEVFKTKKRYIWHTEIHDAKPKACSFCSEKFVHMSSLTRHMRLTHNKLYMPDSSRGGKNVECPVCKKFYLKTSLELHMKIHAGVKPFSCNICTKEFTTKWNLKLHRWTHAARVSKPFKCSLCQSAFIRHTDYTAHMNSHRNIKPYTCNHCGRQFIRKYNCQRHAKEHDHDKSFKCTVCNKEFHRSYYLREHLRVHSGVRPFSCHICGKMSTTKSNHNKHVRIHHAREPVSTEN